MSGREKPSRRKPSATSRLRRFWFVFALILIVVGVGAFFAASWPALYPHRIVVTGNRIVPAELILSKAAIDRNRNLWLQSTRSIAARVKTIPYVDGVWIHRRLPADATIVVTERVPLAVVDADGQAVIVDRSLRVLSSADGPSALPSVYAHLAVVPDAGATIGDAAVRDLVVDLQAVEAAGVSVRRIEFDRFGGLVATRRDGIEILLGDDDTLPAKLMLLGPIERQTAHGRPLRAIDLRAPATPVIVYKT